MTLIFLAFNLVLAAIGHYNHWFPSPDNSDLEVLIMAVAIIVVIEIRNVANNNRRI